MVMPNAWRLAASSKIVIIYFISNNCAFIILGFIHLIFRVGCWHFHFMLIIIFIKLNIINVIIHSSVILDLFNS